MRDLARLRVRHIDAHDGVHHHEDQNGEQQVHGDSRKEDYGALPEGKASVLLVVFAFEEGVGVVDQARLSQLIGERNRLPRRLGALDLPLGGTGGHRAVGVKLVLFRRTLDASPLHQLIEGSKGVVVGDAAILRDVFHVCRPAPVYRREHAFQMGTHLARLHPAHLRIAAKGNAGHTELRAPFGEADARPGKADHELGHAHAKRAGCQIMPALVDEHEEAEQDRDVQNHKDNIHASDSSEGLKGYGAASSSHPRRAKASHRITRSAPIIGKPRRPMRPAQKTYTPCAAFVAEPLPTFCQVFTKFLRMHVEFALEISESRCSFSLVCRDCPPTFGNLRADNAR